MVWAFDITTRVRSTKQQDKKEELVGVKYEIPVVYEVLARRNVHKVELYIHHQDKGEVGVDNKLINLFQANRPIEASKVNIMS